MGNGRHVRLRQLGLVAAIAMVALSLSGCPKDPYRAAIQGSSDVSQVVSSSVKLTAQYYSTGKLNDRKKAQIAGVLNTVTDCNMEFRKSVTDVHNSGATGISAFLPIADSFVHCAQINPEVMADPAISNVLKSVDLAINGVRLAVANSKGVK